jgi:hypothetical protein
MATAAGVTGAPLPENAAEDSFDVSAVLLGKKRGQPIHEAIVHHSADGTFGVREGPWKLAMALGSHGFSDPRNIAPRPGEAKGQLYHLGDDPAEEHNLWLEKPDVVKRLTAVLEKYQRDGRSRPHEKR